MIDVRMRKEIEASLGTIGRPGALAFASRAALRVVPLLRPLVDYSRDADGVVGSDIVLTAWCACAAAWVAASHPVGGAERTVSLLASSAEAALGSDNSFLFTFERFAAASALAAAAGAAFVAAPAGENPEAAGFEAATSVAVIRAVAAMAAAAESHGQDSGAGAHSVQRAAGSDLSRLKREGAEELMRLPLWLVDEPDWTSREWEAMKQTLIDRGAHWQVWTAWQDARRRGEAPATADIERARIVLDSALWGQGAAAVNAEIARRVDLRRSSE